MILVMGFVIYNPCGVMFSAAYLSTGLQMLFKILSPAWVGQIYRIYILNPLSPTPTAGSQLLKSHAKGSNSVHFDGYETSKKEKKIQNKKICIPFYFLQLPDTFFFHLIYVDIYKKREKKAPPQKKIKSEKLYNRSHVSQCHSH